MFIIIIMFISTITISTFIIFITTMFIYPTMNIISPMENKVEELEEPASRPVSVHKNRSELLYDKDNRPLIYLVYHSITYRGNLWFKWDGKVGGTRAKYNLYKITECNDICDWYEMGFSYAKDLKSVANDLLQGLRRDAKIEDRVKEDLKEKLKELEKE